MEGAGFVIVFDGLTEEEVLALEDALIREQRRRVLSGERSWVIERILTTLWSQLQTQYPPTIPNSPVETDPDTEPESSEEPGGPEPEPEEDGEEPHSE